MDDVGEQTTGVHTALTTTNRMENFHVPSGKVFPSIARGLLTDCHLFLGLSNVSFFGAESLRNACTFLSEKSPLGFRGAFFYRLSREEFSAAP
jgi:hypothetical protein